MEAVQSIHRFVGDYRYLSNFYIEPDSTHIEGEYQAEKYAQPQMRELMRASFLALGPREAKRRGRKIPLRADWDQVKVDVMYRLVKQKFIDHYGLRRLLVATEGLELIHGNDWGDRFWGVCRGDGENWLGRILMQARVEMAANPFYLARRLTTPAQE